MNGLLAMAFRIGVMYVFALVFLRISGKRAIGSASPVDFMVALILGDLFDDVIWGEIGLAKGLTGFAVILLLHILVSFLQSRSRTVERVVNETPTRVIQNGQLDRAGQRQERLDDAEVFEMLRGNQEELSGELAEGLVEISGELSLKKKPEDRPAQEQDAPRLRALLGGKP